MDQVLPHSGPAQPAAGGLTAPKKERTRPRTKRSGPVGPVAFLLGSLLLCGGLVFGSVYTTGYTVSVDGTPLGVVAQPEELDAVVEQVEARASRILGYDYTLEQAVTVDRVIVEREEIVPADLFVDDLFDGVSAVAPIYTLTIDGQYLGASADREALQAMLDEITAPYLSGSTVSAGFTNEVVIRREYAAADTEQNLSGIYDILHSNTQEEVTYTAVAGDTYSGIAAANDMTTSQLLAMNPQASIDSLMVGDELIVTQSVPFLSVQTVERSSYTEEVPCPVEEIPDDTMYQGDTEILEKGTPGLALVTADVTYINGEETGRVVNEIQVLQTATTQVVAVGTKERPKTMPKGYFIWPCYGTITSYYGYRSIFGSYSNHGGMDIAVAYGTPIVAADGGTVVWAGDKGTYGLLVVIDHGGGKQTYYGHNSRLYVSAGEKVYQGQVIAGAGSTGRSTGNHCHFEVRINGQRVDPLDYLP